MAFIGLGILRQFTYHMIKIFPARLIPTHPIKEAINNQTHLLEELMTLNDWSSKSNSTTSGQSWLSIWVVKVSFLMMLTMQLVFILSPEGQRPETQLYVFSRWKLLLLCWSIGRESEEEKNVNRRLLSITELDLKVNNSFNSLLKMRRRETRKL